ncbi:hypothetical protein M3699_14050 [Peribacillus simplex]|uniref:hypothetical protein n=1 Tax=Peribacillus simplex TaxID=1478 RepID=UPI00203D19D0|nr:hypothetical protein [Peribacillus simplex]MCM3674978.1 hypothetical protein [Peribacillus simplex]
MKKFATLLPNNWLVKTPQPLALMRFGRQSAERERISEINWNFSKAKTEGKLAFFELKGPNRYISESFISSVI